MKKLLLCCLLITSSLSINAQCTSVINVQSNSCGATCSGTATFQFSGGQLPLTIYVDTLGPFTVTTFWQIGNLCPGLHSLLVIDAAGDTCTGMNSFTITTGPIPDAQVITSNATCSACADGSATINTVLGGTPPFTYQWSNGSTAQSVNGLMPGIYSVYVVDANGCVDVDTFSIGVGNNGYYTVSGEVYFDANSNGIKDGVEAGLGNQSVMMMPGSIGAITNNQGTYSIVVAPGSYDVTYQANPGWNLTSSPATLTAVVTTGSVTGLDFGVFPDSAYGAASAILTSGLPRCLSNVPYYLTVHNSGFTILDGTINFTHDPLLTFVNSSITPNAQVANVLTYDFTNLHPGQSFIAVVTFLEPAAGNILSSTMDLSATDIVGSMINDTTVLNQVVSCSYDPNDKQVQPAGVGISHFVTMDSWLYYQIRFQNTGNDTAFQVVLLDTLDNGLDISTLRLIGSSHQVDLTVRPGRELTFTFDDILLPDSVVNEPASHGYVLYRVKGLSSNPDPTIINNTAAIYFDLNPAVLTNVTLTTLSNNFLALADPFNQNSIFELFPNPVNDIAVLQLKGNAKMHYEIALSSIQGRKVMSGIKMTDGKTIIKTNQLPAGTYILEAIPQDNGKPVYLRLVKY